MSGQKVLLMVQQIVTERNYERFHIKELLDKFELVIFDFTYVLHKKVFDIQISEQKKNLNVIHIKTRNDFLKYKDNLSDFKFIISFLGNIYEGNHWIYQSLKVHQRKICIVTRNGFPSVDRHNQNSIFIKVIQKLRREKSLSVILRKLKFHLERYIKNDSGLEVRYIVSGGEGITKQYKYFFGSETELVKSCTDDYIDSFSQTTKKVIGDYYVFLDENLIDHSDFLINDSSVEDCILYYSEICRFFRFLENKYGIEVVIAAHPRANLDKTRIRFPGHKVFSNETSGLVKYCNACITHASTSINFAVIFQKPIIFLTSDRMIKTRNANEIIASWFNKRPLNMSNIKDVEKFNMDFLVDKSVYSDYLREFVSYSGDCSVNYEFLMDKQVKR